MEIYLSMKLMCSDDFIPVFRSFQPLMIPNNYVPVNTQGLKSALQLRQFLKKYHYTILQI